MKRRKWLTGLLAALLAGILGSNCLPVFAVNVGAESAEDVLYDGTASEELSTEDTAFPANPVYDPDTDTTKWSYVYFGAYPQTEVTGEALTDEIVNADYDRNGDAVIGGQKYRRLARVVAPRFTNVNAEACYKWDNRTYAYFRYEPIRWRVLQNDGETLFLLAEEALDCKQYSQNDGRVTWNTCFVRRWLNGYDACDLEGYSFYSMAFSDREREAVRTTHVTASDNPFNGISGGEDTDDKVFLLSVREAMNPQYGFPDDLISDTKTRRIAPTDYAFAIGAWLGTYNDECYGNTFWLLRSPGAYQQAVSIVYNYGHVYQDGYYADERCYAICPAIKISADCGLWTAEKPSPLYGDVTQDGTVTPEDAQLALQAALGLVKTNMEDVLYADADGDGTVTLTDARLILRCALKIDEQLPVGMTDASLPEKEAFVYRPDEVTYPAQKETTASGVIWIAADSIAAYHSKSGEQPLYGWGELLGDYFDGNVTVQNQAVSGSSTKSFSTMSQYSSIMKNMKAGDYLLVSFGHNDERAALSLYADPYGGTEVRGSFKWNLKTRYIDPALEKGVQPVLITPVMRRYFENGVFVNPQLHTAYAQAMRELSEEYAAQGIHVPVIDLHSQMGILYEEIGEDGTKLLHGLSNGVSDNTHFCKAGAEQACKYIIEGLQALELDICDYLQ